MSTYQPRQQEGTEPIEQIEFAKKTGKRAVYEEFDLTPAEGHVEVTNASHGDDARDEHTYRVDVVDGVPTRCDCPADQYHDGACKHRVALALAEPVLEAATPAPVATDGGQLKPKPTPGYTEHVEPGRVGGKKYVRCEGCERELLVCLGGRENLLHAEGCPNAREDRR